MTADRPDGRRRLVSGRTARRRVTAGHGARARPTRAVPGGRVTAQPGRPARGRGAARHPGGRDRAHHDDADAGGRRRARGRLPRRRGDRARPRRHRRDEGLRRDDLRAPRPHATTRSATSSTSRSRPASTVTPGARRNFMTTSACGVCGKTSIDDICVLPQAPLSADDDGLRARPCSRRCPTGCARRSGCSPPPAGCTRPGCSPRPASCSPSGRTSGGTTRSTRSSAGRCSRTSCR